MKIFLNVFISFFFLLLSNSHAADIKNGESLHNENCLACHGTGGYHKDVRKVHDITALTNQVKRCDFNLGTQWFDEDIEDAVAYLNSEFYHLE